MSKKRSDAEQQIAEILGTARSSLRMSVAFLSRLDGTTQHLQVVDSAVPLLFHDGITLRQETSLCQAVLDGKLPPVIPDVSAFPDVAGLPAVRIMRVRSYVMAPVQLSDGTLYGTLCAFGFTADANLDERNRALVELLASAAAVIIEPEIREQRRRAEISSRLSTVIEAEGPVLLLQPIVDLATGRRIGAEALSRFPADWERPPDVCFAEAHSVGLGHRLELLALQRAADHLPRVGGYVAMNVSPATLVTRECRELLDGLPLDRILLELSEHEPVEDYGALTTTLAPFRRRGLRLAIDDVGAGFSSLRHIVVMAPDVIKIDQGIIGGMDRDPVLSKLVASLVEFGHGCGIQVVAEGIETPGEAAALRALGVDQGQGWHFGHPGPAETIPEIGAALGPVEPDRDAEFLVPTAI
jgi:EAL domain-containing protein (putative c-di-GMP-specific phosphodiesterase class I)